MTNETTSTGETQNVTSAENIPASVDTGSTTGGDKTVPGVLTPEQQADATKAAEDAKKAETTPEGAPEKYEFKLPEGATLDPSIQAKFEAVARDLNMPQASAQKILEAMGPQIAAAQNEAAVRVRNEWAASAKSDTEFGGDNLDANLAIAKKAVDTFGTPALKLFLDESGLGNHPEMIRMMFKAGKALSEDRPGGNGTGVSVSAPRVLAKALYPSSN